MEAALPDPHGSAVDFVGPFQYHDVVVNGWTVPLLQAHPMPGGQVTLTLDRRFALDLSLEEAERIVPFIAHSIAVALGFSAHPDSKLEPQGKQPHEPRKMVSLDSLPNDSE